LTCLLPLSLDGGGGRGEGSDFQKFVKLLEDRVEGFVGAVVVHAEEVEGVQQGLAHLFGEQGLRAGQVGSAACGDQDGGGDLEEVSLAAGSIASASIRRMGLSPSASNL